MRLPAVRYEGDDTPLAWWEVPFLPLVALGVRLMLLGAMFVSVPLLALYPDLRYISAPWDERTEREQEVVRRYLHFTSRVTFWERVRRLLTIPCGAKRRPSRREVRRATRTLPDTRPW